MWISVRNKLKQILGASGSMRGVTDPLSYELNSTLVSILMPVYNPNIFHLVEAIESAANQSHKTCEIIVVNDASTDPNVNVVLQRFVSEYENIVYLNLEKNLGIAGASQAALDRASGYWVGLLDQDDLLESNAVEAMLRNISNFPNAGLAYSDSDKLDANGTLKDTYFKGDWSPERLRGNMYLAHFTFFRRDLAQSVGGFRSDFDGAQDHDLALRISETKCDVVHTPEVLYHWRISPTSTSSDPDAKPFARDAGKRAIQEHLQRAGIPGVVNGIANYPGFYEILREPSSDIKVSIVIPTRGTHGNVFGEEGSLVLRCIQSIVDRPQNTLGEVVLVADEVEDLSYLESAKTSLGEKLKIVMYDKPFNFSEKVNFGISKAINEFVLVLNDDVEMISDSWLDPLVAILEQEDVGAVGPLLRFEDGSIQHGGHYYARGVVTHRYLRDPWNPGYFGDLILDRESSGVTAAFLLVKKMIWEQVGGFSIDFPNNFNDVDFCLKIRNFGYRIIFSPRVEAYHFESKSRDSTVKQIEVERLTEIWAHEFWQPRDPFGPGGKPEADAIQIAGPNVYLRKILGNIYYGRRPLLALDAKRIKFNSMDKRLTYNYEFKLMFPQGIPDQFRPMMQVIFEDLVKEFNLKHEITPNASVKRIEIWVSANVGLGWNYLEELVAIFENNSITYAYSDYVDSCDSYQSLKKLPGWSHERFLGIQYIGRVVAIDVSDRQLENDMNSENYLHKLSQTLLDANKSSIGRIPEILYRVLTDPLAIEINKKHLDSVSKWIKANRPKLKFDIENSIASYRYSSTASGSCSIIIPTRFSLDPETQLPMLNKCLVSLSEQEIKGVDLEVILVVDEDSYNDSNRDLVLNFQKKLNVSVVVFDRPFNFSTKCNLGAAQSSSEYLIFLNDDTQWISKESLREILGTLSLPKVGAVGALLRYPNGLIQHGGIILETPGPQHAYVRQSNAYGSLGDLKVTHEVSAVTGACIGMRRLVFEEVGAWDEKYPGSYNDVDLCLRITQKGYSILLNPNAVLTHFESLSRNPLPRTQDVNRMLSSWLPELSWERFLRSSDANGVNDQGEQICAPKGQDLSGKYVQYAIYLGKKYGIKAIFTGAYRLITGTSRRWKSYKKIPSVY